MSRETILVALASRLGAVRAPWATIGGASEYTILADGAESVIDSHYNLDVLRMSVGVSRVARAASDAARSTEANALLADLKADALGSDPTLGGLCVRMQYQEGRTEYPTDGTNQIGATAIFFIDYEP